MKNYSLNKARALILIGVTSGLVASGNAMLSTNVNVSGGGAQCSATGTASAGCNVFFQGIGPSWSPFPYTGSEGGNAAASYRDLFAGVLVSATASIGFYATATATSVDTLTVLGGTGNGYIRFLYDGLVTSISEFDQTFTFQDGASPVETYDCCFRFNVRNQPFVYQTMLYPFTFGVPFTIQLSANAITAGPGDAFGQGALDVNFVQFNIFDQNRNPDENAYIVSDSGETYSSPEPTSVLLLGTLLSAFALVRFRNRSRGQLTSQ